jgi:hypothetical protein
MKFYNFDIISNPEWVNLIFQELVYHSYLLL